VERAVHGAGAGRSGDLPEKLVEPRLMKDIKDITQILMQIAVTWSCQSQSWRWRPVRS
jgi:hypothetical protein